MTGMQASGPEPPSPGGPGSPLSRNFFGGSFFTTPPEEVGDMPIGNARRKSWWGGEKDSSHPIKVSGVEKKPEKEKQRSDKEKSKDEPSKQKKTKSNDQKPDEKEGAERVEAKVQAKREGVKEETMRGGVGNGPLPVGEKMGEVRTVGKQFNAETTRTVTGDYTARSLREAKSLCSLNSNQSNKDSGKSFKLPWSLIIAKRSTLEQMPVTIPSKKLTEDVAGPRFESVREPAGERCAGDYPPVYENGFVSSIHPRTSFFRDAVYSVVRDELHPGESFNPGGNSPLGA